MTISLRPNRQLKNQRMAKLITQVKPEIQTYHGKPCEHCGKTERYISNCALVCDCNRKIQRLMQERPDLKREDLSPENSIRMDVRMPHDLKQKLVRLAAVDGISQSQVIRNIIREYNG